PKTSKAIGRRVNHFNATSGRVTVCGSATLSAAEMLAKSRVAAELLATGDRKICEASRTDKIWGIGMDARDVDVLRPNKWRGKNELGKSWMRVREYLK
ncbi:hypothetical protein BCR44DRAFT_114367, partial [Catenaria anguillulae PL171]